MGALAPSIIQRLSRKETPPGVITAPSTAVCGREYHVHEDDNRIRSFAMSVLFGFPTLDGEPPILPADQAADVLRWAGIPH